jgi:ArsR family transcriptional regulator
MVEFGPNAAAGFGNLNTAWAYQDRRSKNSVDLAFRSGVASRDPSSARSPPAILGRSPRGARLAQPSLRKGGNHADHWLGFSEVQLHQWLEEAGFSGIEVSVVSREKQSPHFQTVFATGLK